jgi:SAM-dependent methyltransferase
MANNDQVLDVYQGRIDSQRSQDACRTRVHWLCERVFGARVLDVGCSQGICPVILGREGREVVGLDIEEAPIQRAREFLSGEPPEVQGRVRFLVADAFTVDLPPASFDTVILGEVLEHLALPAKLLKRVAGWLVEGGRVVVSVPLGYHAYHDHKQTFYLASLLELLGEQFAVAEVEVIDDLYLCAWGVKLKVGEVWSGPDPQTRREWDQTCARALERMERRLYERAGRARSRLVAREADLRAARQELRLAVRGLREERARERKAAREELRREQEKHRQARADLQAQVRASRDEATFVREELTQAKEALEQLQGFRQQAEQQARRLQRTNRELERLLTDATAKLRAAADKRERTAETDLARRQRLENRVRRLQGQAQYLTAELERRRREVRYRLGDALVRALRPSKDTLLLPVRLVQLFAQGLRQRRARRRSEPGAPATGLPPTMVVPEARPDPEAGRPSAPLGAGPSPAVVEPAGSPSAPVDAAARLAKKRPEPGSPPSEITFPPFRPRAVPCRLPLKVATILDDFSHACFSYEMELIPVTKAGWKAEIERSRPAFFFAESAWHGNNDEWKGLFHQYAETPDSPLRDLLGWCREHGLPTVIWNKEDPPNYEHFINVARDFQYVFTTDAGSLDRYRLDLGHDRVYVLPFAAQPAIHNPLGACELRRYDVCFAGSWHAHKHPGRRAAMKVVVEPALAMGLHIFDRCATMTNNQQRRFPEVYQPAIKGCLDYERMLSAYRAYRVFLNVNSVAESSTMFSRRVFELLACQTAVISSESEGIRQMFGKLVPIATSPEQTQDHLSQLLGDAEYRERLTHLGYRCVMTQHTYRDRLWTILSTIGLEPPQTHDATVSVLAVVRRPEELEGTLDSYACQKHSSKELLLVVDGPELSPSDVEQRAAGYGKVQVCPRSDGQTLGDCLNSAVERCGGRYIALLDGGSRYGADYLTDALIPFRFAATGVVGKRSHYCYLPGSDRTVLRFPGQEHQDVDLVQDGTLVVDREVLRTVGFAALSEGVEARFQQDCKTRGVSIYSADRFNFLARGAPGAEVHAADGDQLEPAGTCVPVGRGRRLEVAMLGEEPGTPRTGLVPLPPGHPSLGIQPTSAETLRSAARRRPPPRPVHERCGFLFYCVNGGGLGHLTRSLAIARRIRRLRPQTPICFLSSSQALGVISGEGMIAYHLPARSALGAQITDPAWHELLLSQLQMIVDAHRPAVLVYDGVSPYAGLLEAMSEVGFAHTAMILRLRHKHNRLCKLADKLARFDQLLFPGEVGIEVPAELAHLNHRLCHPIVFLDCEELLPRQEARCRLNLAPDKRAAYVQLGAGNINDIGPWVDRVLDVLSARDDVEVVLAESPAAERGYASRNRVHVLRQYPNSLYFNGFDLAVTAAGYNTFHELMHFGLPAVLIPNQETLTDDQVERARVAEQAGAAKVVLAIDQLADALTEALKEEVAARMRKCALALVPHNGAQAVAEWLLESVREPATPAPKLVTA